MRVRFIALENPYSLFYYRQLADEEYKRRDEERRKKAQEEYDEAKKWQDLYDKMFSEVSKQKFFYKVLSPPLLLLLYLLDLAQLKRLKKKEQSSRNN